MRISTVSLHDSAASSIVDLQAKVARTQLQIASGKNASTAADDPVGAARVVRVGAGLAQTNRWQDAQTLAKSTLSLTDSTLGSMYDALTNARTAVIGAGNGALAASERQLYATQLRESLKELTGLANATDVNGTYLFAGYNNQSAPFVQSAVASGAKNDSGVAYGGDNGQRLVDLGPGSRLAVTQNGNDAFVKIPDGNGVFTTSLGAANTGTGVVSTGRVTDATALTGKTYVVKFDSSTSSYNLYVAGDSTPFASGFPFPKGGGTIDLKGTDNSGKAFDLGMSIAITGAPAVGDSFTVAPSGTSSLFDRVQRAINALEDKSTGSAADARRSSELTAALHDIDVAGDHLLQARGTAGIALNRINSLSTIAQNRELAQTTELSTIQDLDYAKAASDLAKQTLASQAAMATYAQVGRKSLFDFL